MLAGCCGLLTCRAQDAFKLYSVDTAQPPAASAAVDPLLSNTATDLRRINCANLVYAANQTSVCLADAFLGVTARQTTLSVNPKFVRVRLDSSDLFNYPFCVFSGEGDFRLTEPQREYLRRYVLHGGFVLASPGCSDAKWDRAFRREFKLTFPGQELVKIPMSHPMFSTVYDITVLHDKKGNRILCEGLIVDERLCLIYSTEGLNDVKNAKGCCCCGGNEIRESQKVNVNTLIYCLLN